jgi:hypothetical protein
MKIVFAGTIAQSGLGGQVWATLQYLLGLRALGHDVVYLEDCGPESHVWAWEKEDWTLKLEYPEAFLKSCFAPYDLNDRWIYRTDTESRGMPLEDFHRFCRSAELIVMRAVPFRTWRDEYDWPRRRVFIDVDPGFTQISVANGEERIAPGVARADRRFTVAQHIGDADCTIPTAGGPWLKTVPPVFLPEWPVADFDAKDFTSVMRWRGFHEATFKGVTYGQRDMEFPAYLDLPRRTSQRFCIAQMGIKAEELTAHGWGVMPGEVISKTAASYRDFIQRSRAEFSVPKNAYVKTRGGWFSDRSVCYLASGRPVLIEDTGLKDWLPVGEGVVTFDNLDGAVAGIEHINADYEQQRRAARHIAETVFATDRVLPAFLEAAMG